ncbi:GLPGLI family protein [Ornithobacterium rhinotracheale]|uniref:GLPGLI family protein n=1 Tax=Ornithobacterium rhinotracheale TaxID=28251 RepID=UPI004037368D
MKNLFFLSIFLYPLFFLAQPAKELQLNVSVDPYNKTKLGYDNPMVYGQHKSEHFISTATPYHEKSLGKNTQNIYYAYKTLPNPKNKKNQRMGLTILQMGERLLKFTDRAILKDDSLRETFSKKDIYTSDLNKAGKFLNKVGFNNNVFIDLNTKQTTVQNAIGLSGLEYTIPTPQLKWQLQKDQKEILGYAVQKATTQYGGREWVAWFAKDIPLSYGPYLFGGLPGLILEMHDTADEHHFTAIAMSTTPRPFYRRIYEEPRGRKTTESEALKAIKISFEDRLLRPFNPIEKF